MEEDIQVFRCNLLPNQTIKLLRPLFQCIGFRPSSNGFCTYFFSFFSIPCMDRRLPHDFRTRPRGLHPGARQWRNRREKIHHKKSAIVVGQGERNCPKHGACCLVVGVLRGFRGLLGIFDLRSTPLPILLVAKKKYRTRRKRKSLRLLGRSAAKYLSLGLGLSTFFKKGSAAF